MTDRFESLENGEVISVQQEIDVLSGQRTFRAGELNDAIKSYLANAIAGWSEEKNGWFTAQGIDCEALRFGSNGWQKGRIRLCLEFCPDEPNTTAQNASNRSIPLVNTTATAPMVSVPVTHTNDPASGVSVYQEGSLNRSSHDEIFPTTISANTPEITPHGYESPTEIPVAGIAAVGTVAVAAAIASVARVEANTDQDLTIPHLADTVLELEEHHPDSSATPSGGLDEIAFDFDRSNDSQGRMIPNGLMELDLTDLSLDFSEQDLLGFEATGMSDPSEEFVNLHDLDKPENSGMLIDEVWNEMNQGNWPGIN
ncbi:KGK domain-containing protein [Chamaesiphon sp. VAR_48_metabat_135_sub]|uniref:KGK domain-containing protein n=1 Tax=Chamaesiphon sp. VAR_48_metabat_135_sub TaxID=2964699 RepID=UPI00286D2A26|nr:KGK domain-containing protein [Chamaesiphon sp. VAR_48_metabat_135_sub]